MIEHINFRYRGPIESSKVNIMMVQTTKSINKVINSVQKLLDDTNSTSIAITNLVKKRGTYHGITQN